MNENTSLFPYPSLIRAATFSPKHLSAPNAWIGHIPFVAWLIREYKPGKVVELGTHTGNSYLAICQAVSDDALTTRCYAVDTWRGDEHSFFYGEEIYSELQQYHDPLYSSFSTLMKMTFDEALTHFEDRTVDLLHIDGLHTYDAVKHDFESWLPKLAPGAIVLFHDTNVRERGFGVWKYWAELIQNYPNNIEFDHSNGLGVLQLTGKDCSPIPWLSSDNPHRLELRQYFWWLGTYINERYSREELNASLSEITTQLNNERCSREQQSADYALKLSNLNSSLEGVTVQLNTEKEINARLRNTYSWRITAPLRAIRRVFTKNS